MSGLKKEIDPIKNSAFSEGSPDAKDITNVQSWNYYVMILAARCATRDKRIAIFERTEAVTRTNQNLMLSHNSCKDAYT